MMCSIVISYANQPIVKDCCYEISPSHCFPDIEKLKRAICQINTRKRGWPMDLSDSLMPLSIYFIPYSKINKTLYYPIKSKYDATNLIETM